ncbi:hypothetical protein BGW38_001846 [Lunasporangiospora selenospora]|uniref:histone acetyltransferase n=1 Tax=Lunasporangiospora selenospora TaxID=979761 RepID=A0A9P6FV14_9FUNG|nr:hypothetical protein BGW38_001846 [Lunasporangiospora selenospora]
MNQTSGTNSTTHSAQEQDPILKCIARELEASFQKIPSNVKPGTTVEEIAASRALSRGYTFRLESFLTRPRTCYKLFPPKVQKSRYDRISVRERLVLVSVGPTAASAPATEQTKGNNKASQETSQVLIAGLEVLEYDLWPISPTDTSRKADTTEGASISVTAEKMVYIAKVDTSGHWPLLGLDLASRKTPIASPAQALVRGYLKAIRSLDVQLCDSIAHSNNYQGPSDSEASSKLSTLSITTPDPHANSSQDLNPSVKSNESEMQQAAGTQQELHRKTSLYIFARAQPQYLFAESAKNPQKYVLDDRKLVRWWKNMISSVYGQDSSDQGKPSPTMPGQTPKKSQVEAFWHIPGIETERQATNIIRSPISALPSAEASPSEPNMFGWTYGYPDKGAKDLAQGLIPQFPDDPKSRMLQSPSCRRGMVDLRTFWELIAIGEECGAGKITGFFRVVEKSTYQTNSISSLDNDQTPPPANDVTKTETKETVKQDLIVDEAIAREQDSTSTGPARALLGSTSAYTKAINYLLELDFSTVELAQDSTRKWHNKVQTWIQRTSERSCLHEQEDQVKEVNEQNTDSSVEEKVVSCGDNTPPSPSWIQQFQVQVTLPIVDPSLPKTQSAVSASGSPAPVLSSTAATTTGTANFLSPGLIKHKVAPESATQPAPAVNMLSAGLIRRKNPVSDSTSTTSSSSSSTPGATFLDPSLIKRRKVGP